MAPLDPRFLIMNGGFSIFNPSVSLKDRVYINSAAAKKYAGDLISRGLVYASVFTRPDRARSREYTSTRGVLISEKELAKGKPDMRKAYYFQFNPQEVQDVKETMYETRPYAGLPYHDYIWSGGGERIVSFKLFMDNTPGSKTSYFRPKSYNSEQANKIDTKSHVTIKDDNLSIPARFDYTGQAFSKTRVSKRGVLDEVELIQSFLYPAPLKEDNPQIPKFAEGGVVSYNQFRPPAIVILSLGPIFLEGVIKSAPVTYTLFDEDLTPIRASIEVEFAVLEFENLTPKTPWRNTK